MRNGFLVDTPDGYILGKTEVLLFRPAIRSEIFLIKFSANRMPIMRQEVEEH